MLILQMLAPKPSGVPSVMIYRERCMQGISGRDKSVGSVTNVGRKYKGEAE